MDLICPDLSVLDRPDDCSGLMHLVQELVSFARLQIEDFIFVQRMGGLHGDEDRDMKATHHHILMDDIKELKDALAVLDRKVKTEIITLINYLITLVPISGVL